MEQSVKRKMELDLGATGCSEAAAEVTERGEWPKAIAVRLMHEGAKQQALN